MGCPRASSFSAMPKSSKSSTVRDCTTKARDRCEGASSESTMRQLRPCRASSAAMVSPVGPPPTTNASNMFNRSRGSLSGPLTGDGGGASRSRHTRLSDDGVARERVPAGVLDRVEPGVALHAHDLDAGAGRGDRALIHVHDRVSDLEGRPLHHRIVHHEAVELPGIGRGELDALLLTLGVREDEQRVERAAVEAILRLDRHRDQYLAIEGILGHGAPPLSGDILEGTQVVGRTLAPMDVTRVLGGTSRVMVFGGMCIERGHDSNGSFPSRECRPRWL